MNATQLRMALTQRGFSVTDAEAQAVHAKIDCDSILAKHRARITYVLWDKRSPINGVPAEKILADPNYNMCQPDGEIALVYKDGVLTMIQPHRFAEGGHRPLTATDFDPTNPDAHATRYFDKSAQEWADAEIIETAIGLLP